MLHNTLIEVLTTKMSVSVSGHDLKHTIVNGKKGYIESTSTQIEHKDVLLSISLVVKTVGDSGCGWLVDDTEDIKSGNGT